MKFTTNQKIKLARTTGTRKMNPSIAARMMKSPRFFILVSYWRGRKTAASARNTSTIQTSALARSAALFDTV